MTKFAKVYRLVAFVLWLVGVVTLLDGGWAYLHRPLGGGVLFYTWFYGISATLGMALPAIASYGREHGPLSYSVLFSMAVASSIFITPFIVHLIVPPFIVVPSGSFQEEGLLNGAIPIGFGIVFGLLRNFG